MSNRTCHFPLGIDGRPSMDTISQDRHAYTLSICTITSLGVDGGLVCNDYPTASQTKVFAYMTASSVKELTISNTRYGVLYRSIDIMPIILFVHLVSVL